MSGYVAACKLDELDRRMGILLPRLCRVVSMTIAYVVQISLDSQFQHGRFSSSCWVLSSPGWTKTMELGIAIREYRNLRVLGSRQSLSIIHLLR